MAKSSARKLAYNKRYYQANKEREAQRARDYRIKNPDHHIKKTYGLTTEQFDAMFSAQGHTCAICGSDKPNWKQDWLVDHCHTSGKVRGILCHPCNVGLGRFKDDTALLEKAIAYLKDNSG